MPDLQKRVREAPWPWRCLAAPVYTYGGGMHVMLRMARTRWGDVWECRRCRAVFPKQPLPKEYE